MLMLFCFREFDPLPFLLWDPPMMLVCLERIYKYIFKVALAGGVGSSWLLSDSQSHTAQCYSSDGAKCVRYAETLLVSTLLAPPISAHTHSYSSTWPLNTHTLAVSQIWEIPRNAGREGYASGIHPDRFILLRSEWTCIDDLKWSCFFFLTSNNMWTWTKFS